MMTDSVNMLLFAMPIAMAGKGKMFCKKQPLFYDEG